MSRPAAPVKSSNDDEEECFYRLCTKQTTCKGYVTYGKWKTRQSSIMCCLFTTMIACLLISVIIPLVRLQLLQSQFNTNSTPCSSLIHLSMKLLTKKL